jgi:hypothetical protein
MGPRATSAARTCTKQFYRDQAAARLALKAVLKNMKPGAKAPVRVYPCDVCDGWHLTSKKVSGKTPPWDRDPNWSRPSTHAPLPGAGAPGSPGRAAAAAGSATHPFTG